MKKLYLFAIFLIPAVCSAQLSLGIAGGANSGKFSGIEPPDVVYTSRVGLNFGGTLAYRLTSDISLTFQPIYSQRGSNIEEGEDTRRDSLQVYEAGINFLILPIFIRVDADNGITYFISGLEFAIPLSSQLVHAGVKREISGVLNNIDILASIGMGLRFSLGKPNLMIEFRYYQGLINFYSGTVAESGNLVLDNFKNSGFQLMAGLEWEM